MMGRALLLLLLVLLVCLPVLAAEGEDGNNSELIFKWINFLVVFGGGAYFARTPLKRKFAEIRQGIRTEIDQARQQRESSQQRLPGIEQRLSVQPIVGKAIKLGVEPAGEKLAVTVDAIPPAQAHLDIRMRHKKFSSQFLFST